MPFAAICPEIPGFAQGARVAVEKRSYKEKTVVEMETLVEFAKSAGYPAVFASLIACGLGIPIPEDVTLVAGGIIAGLGYANVHVMFFVGLIGVIAGDGIVFAAGHFFGERILRFRFVARLVTPQRFLAVQDKFERYGKWLLFFARFMPGLRTPIFLTAGISRRISYWRFLATDGSAAVISVPVWVYLGYYGADNLEWLRRMVSRGQTGLFIMLGVALFGVAGLMFRHRFKQQKLLKGDATREVPLVAEPPSPPSSPSTTDR